MMFGAKVCQHFIARFTKQYARLINFDQRIMVKTQDDYSANNSRQNLNYYLHNSYSYLDTCTAPIFVSECIFHSQHQTLDMIIVIELSKD